MQRRDRIAERQAAVSAAALRQMTDQIEFDRLAAIRNQATINLALGDLGIAQWRLDYRERKAQRKENKAAGMSLSERIRANKALRKEQRANRKEARDRRKAGVSTTSQEVAPGDMPAQDEYYADTSGSGMSLTTPLLIMGGVGILIIGGVVLFKGGGKKKKPKPKKESK